VGGTDALNISLWPTTPKDFDEFERTLSDMARQCPKCGAELHACQQCTHFATGQRFECTQPVPERIADKRTRNDCTFFSLRATVERETSSTSGRPDDPHRALNDLFKK
jgi:hypothetical protein